MMPVYSRIKPAMRFIAILISTFLASISLAQDVDPFLDANAIVIHAHLKAISRTAALRQAYDGDRMDVSNSCGYDTAIMEVKEVLLGEYKQKELSAHLTLGEWCGSILQRNVRDYVLYLKWDGDVWKVDQELSSPLAPTEHTLWVVQPSLIAALESKGQIIAQPVHLPESVLADLAIGQAESMGLGPGKRTSRAEQIRVLKAIKPAVWASNPFYFQTADSLDSYRKLLASKYHRPSWASPVTPRPATADQSTPSMHR